MYFVIKLLGWLDNRNQSATLKRNSIKYCLQEKRNQIANMYVSVLEFTCLDKRLLLSNCSIAGMKLSHFYRMLQKLNEGWKCDHNIFFCDDKKWTLLERMY